jgi:hypothetical protein
MKPYLDFFFVHTSRTVSPVLLQFGILDLLKLVAELEILCRFVLRACVKF